MDRQSIQRIVEAALTAPSGDNCQPWHFSWNGRELTVFHIAERGRHDLNRKNHTSLLSLGCVLELIQIAASAEGLKAKIKLENLGRDVHEPWARISLEPCADGTDPLFEGIALRATDRRLYHGGKFSDEVFKKVNLDARKSDHCGVHLLNEYPEEFTRYLLKCEEFVWDRKKALVDFLSWLRLDKKSIERTRDGLPWMNLGVNFVQSRMLALLQARPGLMRILKGLGFKFQIRALALQQLKSSAGLICFSVNAPTLDNLVRAGRLAMRTWLHLNLSGYGVQPMSISTISIFDSVTQAIPSDVSQEYRSLFARAQLLFSKAFSLPQASVPVWMFRTGRSPALPKKLRTLRLPLEECLELLDQAPNDKSSPVTL